MRARTERDSRIGLGCQDALVFGFRPISVWKLNLDHQLRGQFPISQPQSIIEDCIVT